MIYRHILERLKEWRNSETRKPLVLRGARQVGKTTVVREFAKDFDTFIYVNLEKSEHRAIFDRTDDVHRVFQELVVNAKLKSVGEHTLLFIDEIQNSPSAVSLLRYFYEEMPEIYVVAAGSLLESLMHMRRISFPVGRVQYMVLRPCSFLEFLGGIGEEYYAELLMNLKADFAHDKIMQLFKDYMLVGGMPDAIVGYANGRNINALSDVYTSLVESYADDVEKYAASKTQVDIVRHILSRGWASAAETISYEKFGESNYVSRDVSAAFAMLEKTFILELVFPTVTTQMPIVKNLRMRPKLLWFDTGLVNFMAGIQFDVFNTDQINDVWRGRVAEQIVAQELLLVNDSILNCRNYWRRNKQGSDAEVDFVLPLNGRLIPIEVKSGHNAKLRSLHSYMDETPHDVAVRIWSGPFSVDEASTPNGKKFRLFNVPFYYVGILDRVLINASAL